MPDPLKNQRQSAAKEFRQSLAALEAFLNSVEAEQGSASAVSETPSPQKGAKQSIDLAALEEAAADIERYMEEQSHPSTESSSED
ncbi:MAG: hypothetical protein F6K04_17800 [Leptolyngbya sp. SIO4C5]|nr:hypothetical protein [Leptolyngbya sp. SIO4C5]